MNMTKEDLYKEIFEKMKDDNLLNENAMETDDELKYAVINTLGEVLDKFIIIYGEIREDEETWDRMYMIRGDMIRRKGSEKYEF